MYVQNATKLLAAGAVPWIPLVELSNRMMGQHCANIVSENLTDCYLIVHVETSVFNYKLYKNMSVEVYSLLCFNLQVYSKVKRFMATDIGYNCVLYNKLINFLSCYLNLLYLAKTYHCHMHI